MIDLHAHTTASDGTSTPPELIRQALHCGLEALAVTDHDTFTGYDQALPPARDAGLELICGIELSTKLGRKSVHLLGYFLSGDPGNELRHFALEMQASRRDRNHRLSARLKQLGVEVTTAEVEARGRGYAGRPHYAQIMVEKGYVKTAQQAFDEYLDEAARGYVDRSEAQLVHCIGMIRRAGGIASLAHPNRINHDMSSLLPQLTAAGLNGLEVYYSGHSPAQTAHYLSLAIKHNLLLTGGSDFHGTMKPNFHLGTGCNGNLNIPREILEQLKNNKTCRANG
jgi:predicted metal-dependent phosphoesterase TrpH